jgi:hypothetical protein
LAAVLPEMAELEFDPSFPEDVLAVTTVPPPRVLESPNRIRRFLETMFQRPRFSWEAAYLGTVLIVAVWSGFANPPNLERSSQFLASTQMNLGTIREQRIFRRAEAVNQKFKDDCAHLRKSVDESISSLEDQLVNLRTRSEHHWESKKEAAIDLLSSGLEYLSKVLPRNAAYEEEPSEK